MKPRLTKRVREGLKTITALAAADLQNDHPRWPESHPAWDALRYAEYLAYERDK